MSDYKVKGSLTDVNGQTWTKEGDFGFLAIGREPMDIEIDASTMSEERCIFLGATLLFILAKISPQLPEKAILAFRERWQNEKHT